MAGALVHNGRDPLERYMKEVRRFPLLTREQEYELAIRLRDEGDIEAAHELVTSNLRFVVKVALEYRSYGLRTLDLVQEGNIGLMHAVKKFDPDRGYRLITYAVWWIRAYIQSYLVKAWSLVKMGTTQAQRKLFFRLGAARSRLEQERGMSLATLSDEERQEALATALGVRPSDVNEMEMRLSARDFSLDLALDEGGETTHLDVLTDEDADSAEVSVWQGELREGLKAELAEALKLLNRREREVIELRYLSDEPPTLREVGERWGVSRERARQIEAAAREKLKRYLLEKSRLLGDLIPDAVVAAPAATA